MMETLNRETVVELALVAKIDELLDALEKTPCQCVYQRPIGRRDYLQQRCVRCRTLLDHGRHA